MAAHSRDLGVSFTGKRQVASARDQAVRADRPWKWRGHLGAYRCRWDWRNPATTGRGRPGANGVLGIEQALRQPADGYSLMLLTSSYVVVNPAVRSDLRFNVREDIAPIARVADTGNHLMVTPQFRATNLQEFVALTRAEPNKHNYGTWGVGSTVDLLMSWLMKRAGLQMNHVSYKSVTQIFQDMQGGNLQVGWADAMSSANLLKAGTLRGLATSSATRSDALPSLPTMAEQGFDFGTDTWLGVFAKRGTPDFVLDALSQSLSILMGNAKYKQALNNLCSTIPPPNTPKEFTANVHSDLAVWGKLARDNGLIKS